LRGVSRKRPRGLLKRGSKATLQSFVTQETIGRSSPILEKPVLSPKTVHAGLGSDRREALHPDWHAIVAPNAQKTYPAFRMLVVPASSLRITAWRSTVLAQYRCRQKPGFPPAVPGTGNPEYGGSECSGNQIWVLSPLRASCRPV